MFIVRHISHFVLGKDEREASVCASPLCGAECAFDLSSSVVIILMDPEVGCPTIFVKVDSLKVVFTTEVIDAVVLIGIFDLF